MASSPARRPGRPRAGPQAAVPASLQVVAGYAGRLLIVLAFVYLAFIALARVRFAVVAVFAGLVLTALLRPVVNQIARLLPRPLAAAISLLTGLAVAVGLFTFVGVAIAGQATALAHSFQSGIAAFTDWLRTSPLHLQAQDIDRLVEQARAWLAQHETELAGQALGGASAAAEFLAGALLALFCTVFFLSSGDRMWSWFLGQIPGRAAQRRWSEAGRTAWSTFEDYTQATVLVAASNALIAAVVLLVLGVPLVIPLAVLIFAASFIPLIGGTFSMAVAAIVAFAARGPWVALTVLILVPVIGQIEGHVLQPLIIGRRLRLHPVAVVLTVVCGGLLGGLPGAALAVPLVAVGWSVFNTLRHRAPGEGTVAASRPQDRRRAHPGRVPWSEAGRSRYRSRERR